MDEIIVDNLKANFQDRICTILTQPVSFPFKDAMQHAQYFTGKVVDVNIYGIWLKHLHVDTYAFYTFPLVGIVEEQLIPNDDPRAEQIKQELKQQEQPMGYVHGPQVAEPSNFIPVESLAKMVKDYKRN